MIESSSGLLLEREQGTYCFANKTFQEYLAAAHVRSMKLELELASRLEADSWRETIRLYAAEADAGAQLLEEPAWCQTPPSLPALTLAVECIQETQRVDRAWREKIENLIVDSDQEHQRIYGEAMLEIRRKKMVGSQRRLCRRCNLRYETRSIRYFSTRCACKARSAHLIIGEGHGFQTVMEQGPRQSYATHR